MLAVEQIERNANAVAEGADERPTGPVADDDVLDGWIASLTAHQFGRVLASLARAASRW